MSAIDFNALIAPITREQFFSEHWEAKPLRISRQQPAYYDSLLSGEDIDYLLSVACVLDREGVALLGPQETRIGGAKAPASQLYQSYRKGASFRIRAVNRYWKPLWTLCLHLQELFGFQVSANLYCTPAGSHGLEKHYDLHDTIILQIAGRKNWKVFGSATELPLEKTPFLSFEKPIEGTNYRGAPIVHDVIDQYNEDEPTDEFELEPGDFLYLPRGFVHQAWSTNHLSAHLTIGIYPITWVDVFTVVAGQLGHKDPQFRKSLPVGFNNRRSSAEVKEEFKRLLKELSEHADLSKALEEINTSLLWNQQGIGEGSITGAQSEEIGSETTVEHRPGLVCRFVVDGPFVRLAAAHGDLSLPIQFEPALRFISETRTFRVSDIPGKLNENSKVTMVRRLIDDGFLRTAKPN